MIIITIILNKNNNNAYISILFIFPRGSRREHVSTKEHWNFPPKLQEIRMFFYYKNKARDEIFEEEGITEQFC